MNPQRPIETVLEGVLKPDSNEPVARIPFFVPEGATRLTVEYEHDDGNIIDLGLQDTRGGPFPSHDGFRGWSGGARKRVFVAEHDATPGYLPGPMPTGTWHVWLGRAQVLSPGCTYRVMIHIELTSSATTEEANAGQANVRSSVSPTSGSAPTSTNVPFDAPWFPGDLQSHTHHSDAKGSVDELLTVAEQRGLAFLAVTDHNTISHHPDLERSTATSVLAVPGMEVTTYRGHANVWGASGWVDFRLTNNADVAWMVDRAHALGGLVSVNHPKTQPGCIGCDWTFEVPKGVDALEAWQGPWWNLNWESLARYDALLAEGRRITLVGGSDRHQPAGEDTDPDELKVGSPTTWVQVNQLTVPGILTALRTGRASVSESPTGPRLTLTAGSVPTGSVLDAHRSQDLQVRVTGAAGERLRWVGAEGVLREVTIASDAFTDELTWSADGPFVRAEVVAEASLAARRARIEQAMQVHTLPYGITLEDIDAHPWRLALTNPIYAA